MTDEAARLKIGDNATIRWTVPNFKSDFKIPSVGQKRRIKGVVAQIEDDTITVYDSKTAQYRFVPTATIYEVTRHRRGRNPQ